jgi:D-alanyl-lipoteichoic acid acyltransferase DltB (MBOAT superfamily)
MLFPTVQFGIFFPIVLALSWALMSRPRWWKPFIIAASYVFYASANPRFCLLLGGVTLGNQAAAKLLGRVSEPRLRKGIVAGAIVLDLGVLAAFKYYAFFATDIDHTLSGVGLGLPMPLLTIALPVGVSFFTFQAISYTVDVYRGLVKPATTLDVAIYLSFFPHLVAGPIVRAREFLPQLQTPRDPDQVAVGPAVALIAFGLIKKVMIADFLARTVVDPVFAVPQAYHAPDVIFAAYAYAAQIYCDFSGYTDMAIGLALLMGFVFPQNFDRPYSSRSLREFWRRWHMTLSRFLRDFLYIPLGGNRKGRIRTYVNLMITMVLGGLWHGAAWTFVLWGTLQGAGLSVEHALRGRVRLPSWLAWLLTFHFVVFAWILFRAQNLSLVGEFLARLMSWDHAHPAHLITATALAAVVGVIGLQVLPERRLELARGRLEAARPVALAAGLALVIVLVGATVPSQGVPPFIYFRF